MIENLDKIGVVETFTEGCIAFGDRRFVFGPVDKLNESVSIANKIICAEKRKRDIIQDRLSSFIYADYTRYCEAEEVTYLPELSHLRVKTPTGVLWIATEGKLVQKIELPEIDYEAPKRLAALEKEIKDLEESKNTRDEQVREASKPSRHHFWWLPSFLIGKP